MLMTTRLPDVSKSEVRNGNGKVVGFDDGSNGEKLAKKSKKPKSQNLSKS